MTTYTFSEWLAVYRKELVDELSIDELVCPCCGAAAEVDELDIDLVIGYVLDGKDEGSMTGAERLLMRELQKHYDELVQTDIKKLTEWAGV